MEETYTYRNQHGLTSNSFDVNWNARCEPLLPVGVGAHGKVAFALAGRLLTLVDDDLNKLSGVAGDDLLLVLGPVELLPWVDGVVYFGRQESASSLLLPTTFAPDVPLALFELAILTRPAAVAPIAVFLNPPTIVPVGNALPINREVLQSWLESKEMTGKS